MKLSRREFTLGTLTTAAAGALSGCNRVNSSSAETIAVLFDGLYTPFWIASHDAILVDIKARGYQVTEAISGQDDAKQLSQVTASIIYFAVVIDSARSTLLERLTRRRIREDQ